jgi:hypothetical protein
MADGPASADFVATVAMMGGDEIPEGYIPIPNWSGWFGYTSQLDSIEKHGITADEYHEMLTEQDGRCAICRLHPVSVGPLCIDHDHDSREVRGLLCLSCNTGLGDFKDNPYLLEDAAKYLFERGSAATREVESYGKPQSDLPPNPARRAYSLELHFRDGSLAYGSVLSEVALGENGQTFDKYGIEWRVSERIPTQPETETRAQAEYLICHEVDY